MREREQEREREWFFDVLKQEDENEAVLQKKHCRCLNFLFRNVITCERMVLSFVLSGAAEMKLALSSHVKRTND